MHGKVPPQALPLEESVLGALMLDKDGLIAVIDILEPESFYLEAHQHIYRAIKALFEHSRPVDLLTVTEQLRRDGKLEQAGGAHYLVQLTNKVASAANIEYHARIIAEMHIKRSLISISTKVIGQAYDDTVDVFDLLEVAEQGLYSITQNNLSKNFEQLGSLAARVQKHVEELSERGQSLTGVPSGFAALDRMTGGWQPSDLIIVAARPGMGKTSLALNFARNASMDHGQAVALFSLEMGAVQLARKIIASEAEIELKKFRDGSLEPYEWVQLNKAIERLDKAAIYIDDTPAISIFELRAKCRRLKSQTGLGLVIVDYLQLMTIGSEGKNKNREQEISTISRSLKALAKELDLPIIALSQLSRQVEARGGTKRPVLSDLRESGAIEQDADLVTFVYRPEYYGLDQDEEGNPVAGLAEFIIAKHRNGATGTVKLRWIGQFTKFADYDDDFNLVMPGGPVEISSRINEGRPPDDPGDTPF